jgi:hypothetical protein
LIKENLLCHKNTGIRIQQQPGSGSGFSNILDPDPDPKHYICRRVLLQGGDTRQLLGPLLPALLDGLLHMAANFSASAEILALILENLAVVSGFTVYTGVGLQCTPGWVYSVHRSGFIVYTGVGLQCTVHPELNYSPEKVLRHLKLSYLGGGGVTMKLAGGSAAYCGQLQRQCGNCRPYTREPRGGECLHSSVAEPKLCLSAPAPRSRNPNCGSGSAQTPTPSKFYKKP